MNMMRIDEDLIVKKKPNRLDDLDQLDLFEATLNTADMSPEDYERMYDSVNDIAKIQRVNNTYKTRQIRDIEEELEKVLDK